MDQLFDGLLVMISGCTALYCWMLGRRLRALQNLRKGMGQAIVNMTKTISSVETNAQKLHRETTVSVAELGAMLAKVDAYEEKVDLVLETMDRQTRQVWKETRQRTAEATASVDQVSEELASLISDARTVEASMAKHAVLFAQIKSRLTNVARNAEQQSVAEVTKVAAAAAGGPREATAGVRPGPKGAQRPWANVAAKSAALPPSETASVVKIGTKPEDSDDLGDEGIGYGWVNPFTEGNAGKGKLP